MGLTQDHTATCCRLSWVLIPGPNMASPLVQGITGALGPGIS